MVVIYHLRPSLLPGGFAGVDVFFVISGYLITGHLWRGYQKTGSVSLLDFWGRRARRLVPAAALVLLVTWLVARVVEPVTELPDIAEQIRASALYFQNWQLASDAVNYLQAEGPPPPSSTSGRCRSRSSSTWSGRSCSASRRWSRSPLPAPGPGAAGTTGPRPTAGGPGWSRSPC